MRLLDDTRKKRVPGIMHPHLVCADSQNLMNSAESHELIYMAVRSNKRATVRLQHFSATNDITLGKTNDITLGNMLHGKSWVAIIKVKESQSQERASGASMLNREGTRSLSDVIEDYLHKALDKVGNGVLEIQRNDLSQKFGCSPSQINYVLETRFSSERGYLIESRRGGGGFIRIIQIRCQTTQQLMNQILSEIGEMISQERAGRLIDRLRDGQILSEREAKIIEAAIDRKALAVDLPLRDRLRSRVLKSMLRASLYGK